MTLEEIKDAERVGCAALLAIGRWAPVGTVKQLDRAEEILHEARHFAVGMATDNEHRDDYISRLVMFLTPGQS